MDGVQLTVIISLVFNLFKSLILTPGISEKTEDEKNKTKIGIRILNNFIITLFNLAVRLRFELRLEVPKTPVLSITLSNR